MRYKGKLAHTVTKEDVGKPFYTKHCAGCNTVSKVASPVGKFLPQDVGKQIWRYKGYLYIENQEQYERRISCQ